MRILKEKSAGLIIDIQERLFPHIHNNEEILRNTKILIEGLKLLELPILITEQYKKGLGDTVDGIKEAMGEYKSTEKVAFSCCDEPRFSEDLALKNPDFVIIAGIETHVCVLQTAIDLIGLGFRPVVVEDCVSSRTAENKRIAINRLRQEGAMITSYESVLFELCRFAGNDTFKAISKLVK